MRGPLIGKSLALLAVRAQQSLDSLSVWGAMQCSYTPKRSLTFL